MMPIDFAVSAFVTLIVVLDPLGLAPAFVALTQGLPALTRRQIAVRAGLIAAAILAGSTLFGEWLLRNLGIGIPAFRIAGGLLLFSIATEMVFGVRTERQTRDAQQALQEDHHSIAAFPLAIPMLAGPGAITATVLLSGQAAGKPALIAVLLGVIAAGCIICIATFLIANRIARTLGETGNTVLSRLLGVILAALAVQFVIDGVRAVLA
jgi:multiple antibiotic resistance protein